MPPCHHASFSAIQPYLSHIRHTASAFNDSTATPTPPSRPLTLPPFQLVLPGIGLEPPVRLVGPRKPAIAKAHTLVNDQAQAGAPLTKAGGQRCRLGDLAFGREPVVNRGVDPLFTRVYLSCQLARLSSPTKESYCKTSGEEVRGYVPKSLGCRCC